MGIKVEPGRSIEDLITSSVEQQMLNGDQCIDVELSAKMYAEAVAEMEAQAAQFKVTFGNGSVGRLGNPVLVEKTAFEMKAVEGFDLSGANAVKRAELDHPGEAEDPYVRLLKDTLGQAKKDGEKVPEDLDNVKKWLEDVEAISKRMIDLGNGWYVEMPRPNCGEGGCRGGGFVIGYVFK